MNLWASILLLVSILIYSASSENTDDSLKKIGDSLETINKIIDNIDVLVRNISRSINEGEADYIDEICKVYELECKDHRIYGRIRYFAQLIEHINRVFVIYEAEWAMFNTTQSLGSVDLEYWMAFSSRHCASFESFVMNLYNNMPVELTPEITNLEVNLMALCPKNSPFFYWSFALRTLTLDRMVVGEYLMSWYYDESTDERVKIKKDLELLGMHLIYVLKG